MNTLKLFLSYASEDYKIIQFLYKRLIKDGYDVWFDKTNIIPGQDWQAEIRRAVKSADVVIVCISNKSITKEGFIQKEIRMALDVANEKLDNTIYIIPIKIEECSVPEPLMRWQWVNLYERNGYDKLVKALHFCLEVNKNKDSNLSSNQIQFAIKKEKISHSTGTINGLKQYFVGHALNPENIYDLRNAIRNALDPFGYSPYYADKNIVEMQQILFTICKKIYSTDFGIFDISTNNPNVYTEIGIAVSLNKNFILIAKEGSTIPSVFDGLNKVIYESYTSLETKLGDIIQKEVFGQLPNLTKNYCTLCRKVCDGLVESQNQKNYVFLDRTSLLWHDVSRKLEPLFSKHDFEAIFLTKNLSISRLICDIRRKIASTKFSILHFGNSYSDEISYLALGLTIGSGKPWLLLRRANDPTSIPSNFEGFPRIEYEAQAHLELLETNLREFIEEVDPSFITKDKKTKSISSSFGILLQEWIENFETQFYESSEIGEDVFLFRLSGNNESIQKIPLTKSRTIIGRDIDTVDIAVQDDPWVSKNHIAITRTKSNKWHVQDLGSENGTKLNANPIPPKRQKRIFLGNIISLSPLTKFLIWDKSNLPIDKPKIGVTAKLNLIPLNLKDVLPPDDSKYVSKELLLVVKVYSIGTSYTYEIQNYYPFGSILVGILRHLNQSHQIAINPDDFLIVRNDKVIESGETPFSLQLKDGDSIALVDCRTFIEQTIQDHNLATQLDVKRVFDFIINFGQKSLGLFLFKKWSRDDLQFCIKKSEEETSRDFEAMIVTTSSSIKNKIISEKKSVPIRVITLNDLYSTLQTIKNKQ